jgi:hypothetical protein
MDHDQRLEQELSAIAHYALWLGMSLGVTAGFVIGVYWPY